MPPSPSSSPRAHAPRQCGAARASRCTSAALRARRPRRSAEARGPLEPAESGREPLQSGADFVERDAELERERRGCERVVDVVETRERELHAPLALAGTEREGRAVEAAELDLTRDHVQRRPGMAAV